MIMVVIIGKNVINIHPFSVVSVDMITICIG